MSERRPRVLMVLDRLDDNGGGGERAAVGLAVSLPRDRYEVWMCSTRIATGSPLRELEAAGVRHVHVDRRGIIGPRGLADLVRLVRRIRPDVVHGHMFGSNIWATLIGRACRVPVVIAHEQTWSYEGQPLRRLIDGRVIGRLAHAFVAVSRADAGRMHEVEHVPAARIHVIPNAWFAPAELTSTDVRAEIGAGPDVPLAACAALMRPQKRHDVLIDAFAQARRAVPTAQLVLAGDGELEQIVRERIAAHGLGDAVHLLGTRGDVDSIWRAADVAVLSSDFEGTPLAILEAMSDAVPVVATDVGGLPDLIDQASGILVARRDPAALGAAMARVLGDRELRERMGAAARERAQLFTAERHAERTGELYEELLRRARGTRSRARAAGAGESP